MVEIEQLVDIAIKAGQIVNDIYKQSSLKISRKADDSFLTQADLESDQFICENLRELYPSIPMISEESQAFVDYAVRETWEYCFLIDPLDGTKEFIQGNGEFTVNIALVQKHQVLMGVIHAPALGITYYAERGRGAFKRDSFGKLERLMPVFPNKGVLRVISSRSHESAETKEFLDGLKLRNTGKEVSIVHAGSALKFGLIAEGKADLYPRFSPTMEWDTAAGQVIVNELGMGVFEVGSREELRYNKVNLVNPGFIVRSTSD